MLVNKITVGFVIQVFDTKKRRFVSQEFVAGDRCEYEDKDGVPACSEALEVDGEEAALPFDMVQPKPSDEIEPWLSMKREDNKRVPATASWPADARPNNEE
jgi:hypothetical protein